MITIKFIIAACCLFLLLSGLNACYFSRSASRKLFEAAKAKGYDLIIVPGVPFENGKWSRTMKGRILWSKYLYDQGIAKNIMYSGSSVYSPYYEGEIMAMYAVALGIPKEHVFAEIKAEHSTENAYYSYKKAKQLGFKTIAVASDPFQTKTLRSYMRKRVSPDAGLIPMLTDTVRMMDTLLKTDPVIDYEQAFNKNFISLKKREHLGKRLRGTMGKNVDVNAYQ